MSEARDEFGEWYNRYCAADTPATDPYASIQWKGTQACMDFHCECGERGHIDSDYFQYNVMCRACGRWYAVGQVVKLIPIVTDSDKELIAKGVLPVPFGDGEHEPPRRKSEGLVLEKVLDFIVVTE